MVDIGVGPRIAQTDYRDAGSNQIDGPTTDVTVGEGGHTVVSSGLGALGVGRTDRDDEWVKGRIAQWNEIPVVAGSDDDDDPTLPGLLHRIRKRIQHIGLGRVRSKREVENADVETVVVLVLHHPVDCGEDLRHVHGSIKRPNLDTEDTGFGSETREVAVVDGLQGPRPSFVATGDDPGHVRPVTVRVQMFQLG